jgi:hypothetical protein
MSLRAAALVAVLSAVLTGAAAAQGLPRTTWWGSLGVGMGFASSPADLAGHLCFTVQRGRHLLAVRNSAVISFLGAIFNGFGDSTATDVSDVGVLYGRAKAPGAFHAAAAAGLGVATIAGGAGGTRRYLTVPLEGRLAWRPTRLVGVVLVGFASVNAGKTFGGLTLGLELGRLL